MNRSAETVSVIIAARDAQASIGRAVASALAEPETAEVVVIDDGSADDTLEAARAADDGSGRLSLRRLETSVGPAGARNLAIASSGAPFIAVLDADDYFLPGRLAALLDAAGGCDFIADDLALETPDGRRRRLLGEAATGRRIGLAEFVLANITERGRQRRELGYLKPLMRRAFLEAHGLSYDGSLRLGEDFVLYARALAAGACFALVPIAGYVATQREDSLSRRHAPEDLRALLRACERLARTPNLDAAAREALHRHRRQVAWKLHLRQVLSARRAGGLARAALVLLSRPGAVGYVVSQVVADKLAQRSRAPERAPALHAR